MKLGKIPRVFLRGIVTVIPIGILILFVWGGFDFYVKPPTDLISKHWKTILIILYGIQIACAFLLYLSGSVGHFLFKRGLKKLKNEGKPYDNLPGISGIMKSYDTEKSRTQWAFIGSIILATVSLANFLFLINSSDPKFLRVLLHALAGSFGLLISYLAFSTPSLAFPRFRSFGLLDVYEPSEQVLYLDNILSDLIESQNDPLTKNYLDEYNAFLLEALENKDQFYEAKEKLYLLNVLQAEMPATMTDQMVEDELAELFGPEDVQQIINHPDFSFKKIQELVSKSSKRVPQFFKVITRLFLHLDENLYDFKSHALYLDIGYPIIATDVTPIFIFLFNNSEDHRTQPRRVKITLESTAFNPRRVEVEIDLDKKGDFKIESEKLPLTVPGDAEDLLKILSEVLEIGDGVLIMLQPVRFGVSSIIRCTIEDEEGYMIIGKTLNIQTKQNIIDKYVSKLFPK